MPLESVTYISDLVTSNPDHNDSIGVADSHLRNIKSALRNTFPNVTAPITSTAAQIDANQTSPARLSALEAASNRLTGDQSLAGNLTIDSAHFLSAGAVFEGTNRVVPPGLICLWFGSLASIPAGWHLCDGTNFTPDLRDRFIVGAGNTYGPGAVGGAAAVSGQSAVAGAHSHDGLTTLAGGHNHSAWTDINGGHTHAGTREHALTIEEMPPHNHSVSVHGGPAQSPSSIGDWSTGGGTINLSTNFVGSGWGHSHDILRDGDHAHDAHVNPVGDHQHAIDWDGGHSHLVSFDIRPPYMALCYIMKQ